ncbi:3-isopropylmalate dehydratase [Paenibacillus alvei]|uniref:LeuD/DmdB family oxidoreductase small subunit n=1 Tax=Paenibacillus alvei TaxID=44250 RepID=UPI002280914B|nr:3-isopropylmalate dehydratase [Paenibacillus alvei]
MSLQGKVHKFGDNINTDDIIAGKYKHKTMDVEQLSNHIMENIYPNFRQVITQGDYIVAGENFGCGSSREQAPQIIKHVGISAVIAKSFARIFFRNSINIGLLVITCDTDQIESGDMILHLPNSQQIQIVNKGITIAAPNVPQEIMGIVHSGGLLAYAKSGGLEQLT